MNLWPKTTCWPRIPILNLLVFIFLISNIGKSHCYDFKSENFSFKGKGLMGDFGDFDNSGYMDFVTYSYNSNKEISTIYIYTEIKKGDDSNIYSKFEVEGECDGLTAADFDSNNFLDILLVMKKKQDKSELLQSYYFLIYTRSKEDNFSLYWDSRNSLDATFNSINKKVYDLNHITNKVMPAKLYEYSSIHPLVADFDGDGYFDIMVQTTDSRLFFWMNFGNALLPFFYDEIPSLSFVGVIDGFIPNPHSSAYVDMDGDCRPDLVLIFHNTNQLGAHVEIWLASVVSNKLTYTKWETLLTLPNNYGMVTFADFDNDGTNDLLVPFCDSVDSKRYCTSTCKIGIAFNKQIPFCPKIFKTTEQECRPPDNLCIHSNMTFTTFIEHVVELDSEYTFIYPLNGFEAKFSHKDFNYHKNNEEDEFTKLPTQLATVTPADFNNNSFLDLIVPIKFIKEQDKYSNDGNVFDFSPKYKVLVIKNTAKEKKSCSYDSFISLPVKDPNSVLIHVATADISDRDGENLLCSYYSLHKENIDLFMKVMTKYMNIDESKYPDNYFLSGSNNNGLTYKLTVIDIHGMKSLKIATLRPQTAYSPLYTPFSMIGLGKTNNYVEEFYLGLSSHYKNYNHMWISIIPSCTVITLPIPLNTPSQWILKLSIIPGKKLFTILITTSIALFVFGAVVLIFDFREKREDFIQAKGFRQKFIIN